MSSQILSPSEITVSKIKFGPVKLLQSGGKAVNLQYEGRNVMIEAPSLRVPYGVNVYDKEGPSKLKYSVDFSLGGADDNPDVRALQDFLEAFDECMIDAGMANSNAWFKMPNPSREVIKAFYTPLVKVSRDAQGNPKPYPPTFKLSLRKKKDGSFETDFYDGTKQPLEAFSSDTPIEQVLPKRSQATAIIQCTGVWFAGSKFGTTWKAVQMRVDSQPEQIRGPAFRSDAPDIRAFAAKSITVPVEFVEPGSGRPTGFVPKSAAAAKPAYMADEDEHVEDEDVDVVAAVLPPAKPAAAAAKPAPVFEEEQVAEAVPVPKPATKVVKKVVKKA